LALSAVVLTHFSVSQANAQEKPGLGAPVAVVESDEPKSSSPTGAAPAAEAKAAPADPYSGPWTTWPKMTGDWLGCRTNLAQHGIRLDVSTTQFYQGVASGGLDQSFLYGGRNDYFLNLDAEKLGLWKGGFVTLHGETRYGRSVNSITGAIMPANMMLVVPQPQGTMTALTGVKFTQFLSEKTLVYAGKINTFDDFKQPLTGAGVLEGFQNTALMFNPIYARTLPYSTYGAGFAYLKDMHPLFSVSVFDTNNTPTSSGFNSFFDNGVTILALVNLPTHFFGLPGHQGISGTYSSGRYTNITPPSVYLDPLNGLTVESEKRTGSWCLAYNFDQSVWVSPDDPKRTWGVFGNAGIADGNPSPIRWYASAGISGASPLPCRKLDSFGIGYYYLGVSDAVKNLAPRLSSLRDEQGIEMYYNVGVTPWFRVSPDIQLIDPFQQRASTAFVLGVRAKIDF